MLSTVISQEMQRSRSVCVEGEGPEGGSAKARRKTRRGPGLTRPRRKRKNDGVSLDLECVINSSPSSHSVDS